MEARAIQRTVRQSARKMRLVIDQIRGQAVPQAYAILRFSKKLAAKQIHKVLKSAVANAEQRAMRENTASTKAGSKAEAIAPPLRAGAKRRKPTKAKKAAKSKKKKESR